MPKTLSPEKQKDGEFFKMQVLQSIAWLKNRARDRRFTNDEIRQLLAEVEEKYLQ